MKKLLLLLIPTLALSQSVPNGTITQGQVWTTTQWNSAWQAKADVNASVAPTGTLLPTTLSYNPLGWSLATSTDNAADLTGNGTNIPGLFVIDELFGGANVNDGRNALTVYQGLTVPTSATNAYRYYVGINSLVQAQVNDHGTSGSPQGILEAITGSPQLTSAATNWFAEVGAEFTMSAQAGSSVYDKVILLLDEFPSDVVHGSNEDSFIDIQAHTGAVGMYCGICFDANAGAAPLASAATGIRFIGSSTIFNGIDFGGYTITSNVLQWNSGAYSLAGVGNATLGQGSFTASTSTGGGVALTTQGVANEYSAILKGSPTSGQSYGLRLNGGTTSADVAFDIQNQTGAADYFIVYGDGHMAMGIPVNTYGLQMSAIGAINILAPFGSSASALTSNGSPSNWAATLLGNSTTGGSEGLLIKAGTNSSDFAMTVQSQAASTYLQIMGDGGIITNGQTDKGAGTINAASIYAGGNLVAGGSTFTIASGCATTSALTGTSTAGSFATTATTCTPVITLPTAAHGWHCNVDDITHPVHFTQTATGTASCTVTGTTTSGDTIVFDATSY